MITHIFFQWFSLLASRCLSRENPVTEASWTQGGCVSGNLMKYLICIPGEAYVDYRGTVQNHCQYDLVTIIGYYFLD